MPPAGRADADEGGCGRPRCPSSGRSRTRRAATRGRGRGETCTTADRPGDGCRPAEGGRRCPCSGSGRSSGQASPALGATGLDHGAATARAHAGAKAVLAGSAPVVGLICTLHGGLRAVVDTTNTSPGKLEARPGTNRQGSRGHGLTGKGYVTRAPTPNHPSKPQRCKLPTGDAAVSNPSVRGVFGQVFERVRTC